MMATPNAKCSTLILWKKRGLNNLGWYVKYHNSHVTCKDLHLPPPRIIINNNNNNNNDIIIIIIITVIIIINNDNVLAKKDSLNPVTVINDVSIYRIGKNIFKHKLSTPSGNRYEGMDLGILSCDLHCHLINHVTKHFNRSQGPRNQHLCSML